MWVKLGNIIPAEASGQKQDLHLGEAPADSQALKHNPRPAGNWAFKSYFVKLPQSNFTKQQHFSSTLLSAFLRSCSRAMHLAFPGSCLVRSQSSSGWGPAPTAGSWHIFTLVRKPPVSSGLLVHTVDIPQQTRKSCVLLSEKATLMFGEGIMFLKAGQTIAALLQSLFVSSREEIFCLTWNIAP